MRWVVKILAFLFFTALVSCATNTTPDRDPEAQTRVSEINIQLGLKYLEMKNYQRSKQKLLLALEENPKLPEANYAMAYFYETCGDMQQADQFYLKALSYAPHRGDVQNNYGTFLCRRGRYQEAIQHFEMAANDKDYLDPASAYENAGWCALKIPDKKLAIKNFQLAVMHDPGRSVALQEWQALSKETTSNNGVKNGH